MSLSKNSWMLIAINTMHAIVKLFYTTFLVAYFLNITGNNIIPASLFYIFTYALMMVGFMAIGPLVKSGKKLLLYRSSFFIDFVLLLTIIYLKEDVVNYIWILGVVLGIGRTFYWLPHHVLISETANKNQVTKYTGYSMFFTGVAKIVMPVVLGYFISLNSFINTSFFVLLLMAIQFVLSFFMKENSPKLKKFNVKALWILATRREKIRNLLQIEFLKGLTTEVIDVLIVLYVIYMFKTNLNLGIFVSVFAICTIAVDFILGNRCNLKSYTKILWLSGFVVFISTSFFVFDVSKLSFIIYNLAIATAGEVIKNISAVNMYKLSQDKSIIVRYRTEYLALREAVLNFGRIISFGTVIFVTVRDSEYWLKYLILILSAIFALIGFMSISLSKQITKCKK